MEDTQSELSELITGVEKALSDLNNAECCETREDLRNNLEEAYRELREATLEVGQLINQL